MDEPTAWLSQARADREAAERLVADRKGGCRCHAIAQYQQTVEKSVKALVCALYDAGVLAVSVAAKHGVEHYVTSLIHLPRRRANRTIQQILHGLLDQDTRAGITSLDGLVPGRHSRRNTECPFLDAQGRWTYPAALGVFSETETGEFRGLARRILDGAGRIISAVRRRRC